MATGIPFGWTVQNATGTAVSGAKVFFYVPGTTTLRSPYTDSALTVPSANPVVADSAGWFLVYLSSELGYDIVVKSGDESITYQERTEASNISGAQPVDATLSAIAALGLEDGKVIFGTGVDTASLVLPGALPVIASDGVTALTLAERANGLLTVRDFGADVDGVTNDEPEYEAMLTAVGYAKGAPGLSLLTASVAVASGQTVIGVPGVAQLEATDAVGNGGGVLNANNTAGVRFEGVDITVAAGLTNQLRGILSGGTTSGVTDLVINNFKGDFQGNGGTYPVAVIDGDVDGFRLSNFDVKHESYILWKPNINAPTSETYQGVDALIYGGRMRGQGTRGGVAGLSIDGNWQNFSIGNLIISEQDDTSGSGGFGLAFANDGADASKARGTLVMNVGIRDTKLEAMHQEDAMRGFQVIGLSALDGQRGGEIIVTSQGRMALGNFIGVYSDTMELDGFRFVDGVGSDGVRNVNFAFGLIYDWGNTSDNYGVELGGSGSSQNNIIGCHFEEGSGSAIFAAGSRYRIAYNHVRSATGYGIVLSSPTATCLIESNNTLSPATLGPIDVSSMAGVSGDKSVYATYELSETPVGQIGIQYFHRAAVITRITVVYEEAAAGASQRFIQVGSGGVGTSTFVSYGLGTSAAQWAVALVTPTLRLVPAGTILTLNSTASGDGDYRIGVRIEWFEYD
jgi:hypothetical protein